MEKTNEYSYLVRHNFTDIDGSTIAKANEIRKKLKENDYAGAVKDLTNLQKTDRATYDKLMNSTISASYVNAIDEETRNLQIMCKERKQGILFTGDSKDELTNMIIDYSTTYSNVKDYYIGDVVKYTNGGVTRKYVCGKVPCKNIVPTNLEYWNILNERQYVAGESYVINDMVEYGFCFYRCIKNNSGKTPTDETYWTPICSEYELKDGDVWIGKFEY